MKTIKTKIEVILLVTVLSISCSKDDDTTNEPIYEPKTYLSKETYSVGTYDWSYNALNQLVSVTFTSANPTVNPSHVFTANSFDNLGRITSGTYDYLNPAYPDEKVENTYNSNGKLSNVVLKDAATNVVQGTEVIEYLGNQIRYSNYNQSNTLTSVNLYFLSDDLKNVVEINRYNGSNVLTSTNVYSNFDNMKTTTAAMPVGYSSRPSRANNHGSDVLTVYPAGTVYNYTFTYEYNADGFVTKRISSSGTTNTYEYIKR